MGGLTSINNLMINPMVSQHTFIHIYMHLYIYAYLHTLFMYFLGLTTHVSNTHIYRDRKNKTATLKCRICAQSFELSPINYLMQPIDIFCAWVDELEESQRGGAGINADTSEDEDDDLIGTHGRTDILQ